MNDIDMRQDLIFDLKDNTLLMEKKRVINEMHVVILIFFLFIYF